MHGTKQMWSDAGRQVPLLARNVCFEYLAIAVDLVLGMVMLPFNVAHLGPSAYGLWVLTTSVTTYFSMLDLGYGSAQVKFAAQYRALRDASALNEIASTLFFLFTAIAVVAYATAGVLAWNLDRVFAIAPSQMQTGRSVLLIVSLYVALGFPFSVFGGITNGFQRYYLNNIISMITSITVAAATVVVLLRGYGLVELVTVTTSIRLAGLLAYRQTAYRAFPLLSIRWHHVRRSRLREVTAFSVFLLVIDIAMKINYTSDTVVIGAFMGTSAVAVWTVGARLILAVRTLSNVLSRFLFPAIVDSATCGSLDRLRAVLVQGTRLSLASVLSMAFVLTLLAGPVVQVWVGARFSGAVIVTQLLAIVVVIRIGSGTAYSVLKGAGQHRFAATCSVAGAVVNLALSIVFVRWWGLVGIALGTLVPVAIVSLFVVFPAACRRAELPLATALRTAVWPAVWPVMPAAVALVAVRESLPGGLAMIVVAAAAGGLVYAAAFLGVAIRNDERQWYLRKAGDLLRRSNELAAT